jgi:hypothetical protein
MTGNNIVNIRHNEIISALGSFEPLPLYKMNKVGLMNRTDIKYLFSVKKLPDLLYQLNDKYKVMEILKERSFPYTTTYLDTADYLFYKQHINGKLERHKIRFRKYVSSGVSYLEIKKKTNKNRTEKIRIANRLDPEGLDQRASQFVSDNTPYESKSLKPRVTSTFNRATLVSLETNERITIDFDLMFSNSEGKNVELPFVAIAELKRNGFSHQSPFIEVIKQAGIHPSGFSKYCMGSIYTGEVPFDSRLKPKLLLIKKLENEYYGVADS